MGKEAFMKTTKIIITGITIISLFLNIACTKTSTPSKSEILSQSNTQISSINNASTLITLTDSNPQESYVSDSGERDPWAFKREAQKGDNVYYLETKSVIKEKNRSGYMLYKRTNDYKKNTSLNILAYDLKSYGNNILVLCNNDESITYPEFNKNSCYLISQNDKPVLICEGYNYNSFEDVIFEQGDFLYYTKFNESKVYKADLNFKVIKDIPVTCFAKETLIKENNIYKENEYFININLDKIENSSVFLKCELVNDNGYAAYMSYTKKSLDSNVEELVFTKNQTSTKQSGDWIYYLGDIELPLDPDEEMTQESLYEIHRKKPDGKSVQNLHIPAFDFDIIGQYIYADTNLVWGDFPYWDTYRYNLDGSKKTEIKYYNMERYYDGTNIYFSDRSDNVFVADEACNKVSEIKIYLPDEAQVKKDLIAKLNIFDSDFEFKSVRIVTKVQNHLFFEFGLTSTSPFPYYYHGYYKINLEDKKIEKVTRGNYYYSYY